MRVKLGEERTKKGPGQYHFLQLELIPYGATMETNQGLQYYLPLSFCKKYSNLFFFFNKERILTGKKPLLFITVTATKQKAQDFIQEHV